MSKINPKNLTYDGTLPPFLARLHAKNSLSDGRQEKQLTRPKKIRNLDQQAEDEPMIFDEKTRHTSTKKEWEDKEAVETAAKFENCVVPDADGPDIIKEITNEKRNVTVHGVRKKRKIMKIVGTEIEDPEEISPDNLVPVSKVIGKHDGMKTSRPNALGKMGKGGKNVKRMKLSFDD